MAGHASRPSSDRRCAFGASSACPRAGAGQGTGRSLSGNPGPVAADRIVDPAEHAPGSGAAPVRRVTDGSTDRAGRATDRSTDCPGGVSDGSAHRTDGSTDRIGGITDGSTDRTGRPTDGPADGADGVLHGSSHVLHGVLDRRQRRKLCDC